MSGLKLSREFVIKIGGNVIARCVDFNVEINRATIDLTTLDSDDWREVMSGQKEWRVTFNALIATSGTNNYDSLLTGMIGTDTPVTVAFANKGGSDIVSGSAYLTQLNFSAQVNERASYSGTLEGTAALS